MVVRRILAIGALALLVVPAVAEAEAPKPVVALVREWDGGRLDARETTQPGVANFLANGDFASGVSGWTFDPPEVGGAGNFTATSDKGQAAVRIAIPARHPAGTVWAYQRVEGTPLQPMDFQVDVRDDARHGGYAIVLREQTEGRWKDLVVEAPPTPTWKTLSARWVPDRWATALYVQLRFVAPVDTATWAEFADARLLPAARWNWSLDGEPLAAGGPIAALPPTLVGAHVATLEVTTASGDAATTSFTFEAPPLLVGRVVGPSLVRAGESASWSAADVRLGGPPLVLNGDFSSGLWRWPLDAAEIGGDANATIDADGGFHGPAARIDFRARKSGTVYLMQRVPVDHATPYAFSVLLRDTGVERYGLLIRETGFSPTLHPTPYPWFDKEWQLPPSAGWTAFQAAWRPHFNDSTSALVFLRAYARPGDEGSVWFDNVSLAPAPSYAWFLDGAPSGTGASLTVSPVPEGVHRIALEVSEGPVRAWMNRTFVAVAAAASLDPTVDGSVRATWMLPGSAPLVGVRVTAGGTTHLLPVSDGAWIDPAPEAVSKRYGVEAVGVDGTTIKLAESVVQPGAFAVFDAIEPANPTRGDVVTFRVRALDPDITALALDVPGSRVPLAKDANGTWQGSWRVPLWAMGSVSATFQGETATGLHGVAPAGDIRVSAFGATDPMPSLVALTLMTIAGLLAPRVRGVFARRRGGS